MNFDCQCLNNFLNSNNNLICSENYFLNYAYQLYDSKQKNKSACKKYKDFENLLILKIGIKTNSIDVKTISYILQELNNINIELAKIFGIPKDALIFDLIEINKGCILIIIKQAIDFAKFSIQQYCEGFFEEEVGLFNKLKEEYSYTLKNAGRKHRTNINNITKKVIKNVYSSIYVKLIGTTEKMSNLPPEITKHRYRLFKKYSKIEDFQYIKTQKGVYQAYSNLGNIIDFLG